MMAGYACIRECATNLTTLLPLSTARAEGAGLREALHPVGGLASSPPHSETGPVGPFPPLSHSKEPGLGFALYAAANLGFKDRQGGGRAMPSLKSQGTLRSQGEGR